MSNEISREVLDRINESVLRISSKMRRSFEEENRVVAYFCNNPGHYPKECAEKLNKHFGTSYTAENILFILKNFRINTISFRKSVFNEAQLTTNLIISALGGDSDASASIEKTITANNGKLTRLSVRNYEQIVLMSIFTRAEEFRILPCSDYVFKLNRDFSTEILNMIIDIIRVNVKMSSRKAKSFATTDEYETEIIKLETALNRQALMIERLQNDFDNRVEEIRTEESTSLICMLNSPKYGYILDLLLQAQQGVDSIKRQRIMLPFEINALPILIRKLLQFTSDCGITPMLENGQQMRITASDIENYQYEGTPFESDIQVKTVEVISPGWVIADKEIVISAPRVKEVE